MLTLTLSFTLTVLVLVTAIYTTAKLARNWDWFTVLGMITGPGLFVLIVTW